MRLIILKGEGYLLLSMWYVYLFIYLFIYLGLSRSTVDKDSLFTMPGMQHVVYSKSSKVLAATGHCLLLIAMNIIKLLMRRLLTI